jgi:ornithine cyclodeaminase/alanine dehydrogenase-like protein (mu-crystallin family)
VASFGTHTGLVSGALKSGKMEEMDLKSLGDLMVGNEDLDPGRKFFISTGVATQDLMLAIKIYEGMVLRRIKKKGGK